MKNSIHVLGQKLEMSVDLSYRSQGCQKGALTSSLSSPKEDLCLEAVWEGVTELNSRHSSLQVNSYGIGSLEMSDIYSLTSALQGETSGGERPLRMDISLTVDFVPNPTSFPGDSGKQNINFTIL